MLFAYFVMRHCLYQRRWRFSKPILGSPVPGSRSSDASVCTLLSLPDRARSTDNRSFMVRLDSVGLIDDNFAAVAVEPDIDVNELPKTFTDLTALFRIYQ